MGLPRERHVDGLRAVAVIDVILAHLKLLLGAFIGVDVFFVISGYVITKIGRHTIGKKDEHGRDMFTIPGFYNRRVKRILPAALVCLAVTVIAGYFFIGPSDYKETGEGALAATLMAGNIHEGQLPIGYFDHDFQARPVNHFWSLGGEEQFYLIFPMALMLLLRFCPKKAPVVLVLIGLGLLCWSGYSVLAFKVWRFYCPANRAWELIAGALLAFPPIGVKTKMGGKIVIVLVGVSLVLTVGGVLQGMFLFVISAVLMLGTGALVLYRPENPTRWQGEVLSLIGMALIVTGCVVFDRETLFPGFLALVPVLGAMLVIVGASNKEVLLNRLLLAKPVLYIGAISFSVYLWHWPIIVYTDFYSPIPLGLWHKLVLIAVTLAVASVSYHFIEKPFQESKAKKESVFFAGLIAVLTVYAVALLVVDKNGWPERFGKLATPVVLNTSGIEINDSLGKDGTWLKQKGLPVIGDVKTTPTFLLAGDSHVNAFVEIFDKLGKEKEVSGFVSFRSGSLPVPGIWTTRENDTPESFMGYNRALEQFVHERNLKHVFLVGRWSNAVVGDMLVSEDPTRKEVEKELSARTLEKNLFALVARLKASGVDVVIVQQLPEHPFHAYKKLVARRGRLKGVSREAYLSKQGTTIDMILRSGARTVDLSSLLFEGDCVRLIDPKGYPIWWDYDHIGGREITRIAGPTFETFFKEIANQKGDFAMNKRE